MYMANIDLLHRLDEIDGNSNYYIASTEKKTPDFFFGKPVYTKSFQFTDTVSGGVKFSKAHGISNIENIWVDVANSFMKAGSGYIIPIISSVYNGSVGSGNNWSVGLDKSYIYIYADGGWNTNWAKIITVRYTKTTD